MSADVIKGTIWEDTSPFLMARIVGFNGAALTQADITSITYVVVDMTATDTAVDSGTLTVSDVIYDTYQTDSRWTIDTTGFNLGFALGTSPFTTGSRTYRIDLEFDPQNGANFGVVFEIVTRKRYRPS